MTKNEMVDLVNDYDFRAGVRSLLDALHPDITHSIQQLVIEVREQNNLLKELCMHLSDMKGETTSGAAIISQAINENTMALEAQTRGVYRYDPNGIGS